MNCLYFVGMYFYCYISENLHICIYLPVVNKIWNGENYCSSVVLNKTKLTEFRESRYYYGFIYIIIHMSDILYILRFYISLYNWKATSCVYLICCLYKNQLKSGEAEWIFTLELCLWTVALNFTQEDGFPFALVVVQTCFCLHLFPAVCLTGDAFLVTFVNLQF